MKSNVLALTLLLGACGAADDRSSSDSAAAPAAPFDELTETIDKAEAVEQQVLEQKERMERALEEAERPPQ